MQSFRYIDSLLSWKLMTAGLSNLLCFSLDGRLKPQFWFQGLSLRSDLVVETTAEAERPLPLSEVQKTGNSILFCHSLFFFCPFRQRECTSPRYWDTLSSDKHHNIKFSIIIIVIVIIIMQKWSITFIVVLWLHLVVRCALTKWSVVSYYLRLNLIFLQRKQ